jgi:hypothetical protein
VSDSPTNSRLAEISAPELVDPALAVLHEMLDDSAGYGPVCVTGSRRFVREIEPDQVANVEMPTSTARSASGHYSALFASLYID